MYEYNNLDYLKRELNTDLNNGLSSNEASKRVEKYGKNILDAKKKKSVFSLFFSQLKDPMIYILLVAIIISFFLKEYSDSIVIIIVVLLNALIGTIQEVKTEKSLEMLKKLTCDKSVVIRDGNKRLIDTESLVVGDLIVLATGDKVGADIRIIESDNLKIDESCLTGESNPVSKSNTILDKSIKNIADKTNLAYMSTLVVNGKGVGVVISTGMNSEVGKIASLLKDDKEELTPLQKKLASLGKLLGIVTIAICVFLFIIAVINKRDIFDMFISSISLAVAAIPEGLPAVVTIVLALGMQRMAKVKMAVKRLPSVETLGAVNIVCSDKTGTITENKLKCVNVYEDGILKDGNTIKSFFFLMNVECCNNVYLDNGEYRGSAIECELKRIIKDKKIDILKHKRLKEKEFNSERKMMSTLDEINGRKYQFTKGAFDKIIKKCSLIKEGENEIVLTDFKKEKIRKIIDEESSKGKRILAFAYKENCSDISEENMIFLGFLCFFDPPREEVRDSVSRFKEAGVKSVMITGDYSKTAFSIAKDVGIASSLDECISGEEIDKLSDEEFEKIVDKKSVFSRVTTTHKTKIVEAFKRKKNVVAMTGDGVNDAPSLKRADVGISMGINGSDVSKEASDMILLDDNFSTIEKAIEEGRVIYSNIKKTILFLLSSNFAEIIVMIVALVLNLPLPLLATHILLVNLLTDSLPALSLGVDKKDKDVMREKPRKVDEGLFSDKGVLKTFIYGVIIAGLTLIAFLLPVVVELNDYGKNINLEEIRYLLNNNRNVLLRAQTYSFIVLSMSELFYSLVVRNIRKTVFRKDLLVNKWLNTAIVIGWVITGVILYSPLNSVLNIAKTGINEFFFLTALSCSVLFIHEIVILAFHMKQKMCQKDKKVFLK